MPVILPAVRPNQLARLTHSPTGEAECDAIEEQARSEEVLDLGSQPTRSAMVSVDANLPMGTVSSQQNGCCLRVENSGMVPYR